MPQVKDLETLVSACAGGGSDRKIACETVVGANNDGEPENNEDGVDHEASVDVPPDYPPESFWLSKDAEYDWFDRNAFYERKDSHKGNSNSVNLNPSIHPNSNSASQRFSVSLKSKASIIGLPKTQKTTYVDSKRRTCKAANIRLFPKRSGSSGKSGVAWAEPSSPKVSCMGRVRSKRCRRRSNSLRRSEKTAEKSRTGDEKKKTGFYSKMMGLFRSKKSHSKSVRQGSWRKPEEAKPDEQRRRSVSVKLREIHVNDEPASEPPGLGGMKRFASGRRSESWSTDDFNQMIS